MILAYRGSTEVLVATPCKPVGTGVGWDTSGDFTHVWFPDGAKVGSHGVVVGDVDLDGHLDLVIDTTLGLRVALGSGDGTFRPRHHEPGDDLDPVNTAGTLALPALLANETNILAMADIDADGFVDFVVPSGIVLSAHGDYKYVHEQRASRWTEAVIADFRRDGRNGVAAASDESGGIQFFTNAGGGHLNEADLRTNNFPQGLTVGDLDGDLFLDLAFVDVPEVQSTLFFSSEIEVAYGRPSSVPETPVSLGRIDQASQLIAGRFAPNPDDDLVDDLCLVGASSAIRDWSIMTDAVTVFAGDGDRNLTSPYVLRRRDDGVVASPIALAAGAFVDLRTNVLALASEASGGTDPVFRLWLQTLRFEAFAETKRVVSDPLPREIAIAVAGRAPAGLLAATKLDGTQRDTFLLVAPHADDPEGAGALVTGHVELSSGEPRIVLDPPQRFRGRVTPDSRLVLADLGGDGRLDALLVTGDVTAPGDLVVFWNDGTGHFDGAGALHFAPPGDVVQDVTCVPVAGGVGCQPIVLGLKTAYALSVGDAQALDAQRLDGVSGGTSIASGDITGDGVFDLAVGDGAGITVYSGVPVLP